MSRSERQISFSLTVVIQIVGWITAIVLTYGAVNARVTVVEDRTDTLQSDVREIRMDVKELLRRTAAPATR